MEKSSDDQSEERIGVVCHFAGKKLTAALHRFTIREMAGEEKYMFEKDQVILSARCMKE